MVCSSAQKQREMARDIQVKTGKVLMSCKLGAQRGIPASWATLSVSQGDSEKVAYTKVQLLIAGNDHDMLESISLSSGNA